MIKGETEGNAEHRECAIVTIILTHLTCKVYINDPVPEGN